MPEPAVVDASPLIVLTRAGQLDLLRVLYGSVIVPESVQREILAHSDEASLLLGHIEWIHCVPDVAPSPSIRSWDLGSGESAVLEWALAHPGTLAVIDDFAARKLARVFQIQVIGVLGLVLLARKRAVIPAARPLVAALLEAGLYLASPVVEDALRLVGE